MLWMSAFEQKSQCFRIVKLEIFCYYSDLCVKEIALHGSIPPRAVQYHKKLMINFSISTFYHSISMTMVY